MEDIKDIIEIENLDEEKELGVEEVEIPTADELGTTEVVSEVTETEDNEPAEEEADEEAASEEETEGEEAEVEEAEEEIGDEDESEEAEDESEELAIVNDLKEQIQTLTNRISELEEANAKLKKTNRKLSSKYQNELDKKEKFKKELKGLSVELLPDEEKKPKEESVTVDRNYYHGDGIGEI